jgi:hypothetical protein
MKKSAIAVGSAVLVVVAAVGATQADLSGPQLPPASSVNAPATAAEFFSGLRRASVAPVDAALRARLQQSLQQSNPDVRPDTIRLLRRETSSTGQIDVYAAAGPQTVCSLVRHISSGATIGSMGCGTVARDNPAVQTGVSVDVDDTFLVTALVPDGVSGVVLRFADATTAPLTITNNTAVYHGNRRPTAITYTDAARASKTDNLAIPDAAP